MIKEVSKLLRKRKKHILTALSVIAALILSVTIWFNIPWSPMKAEFERDTDRITADSRYFTEGFITEENTAHLPAPVRDYLKSCGYIGTPVRKYMKLTFRDVAFKQGADGPALTIDYTLYDISAEPCRMAFIDSSMFGVPFQGYDYYENGTGGMKGVLAKGITLFDERGEYMDRACLVTYLAESLCSPSVLLYNDITFEEIDEHSIRAQIRYNGCTADGVFTFNDEHEMISFRTEDRNGDNIPWSVICSDYKDQDGIRFPSHMTIIWHYPEGDLVYFDGDTDCVIYG